MTLQASALEEIPLLHTSPRPFFQRFGMHGTCVLPAEVLDDTRLSDPETGHMQPSLRQCCSQDGQLCYAGILYSTADGLYWATVAATPDFARAERVLLTETHLTYALAWDERLSWRTPTQIRRLMQAQAEELAPLHPHTKPAPADALFLTPVVPLAIVTTVEVTPDELREAFDMEEAPHASGIPSRAGLCRSVQQGLLYAMQRALQELQEDAADPYTAHVLHALTALVRHVRDFQRQTHQRVVNAVRTWDAASHRLAWALTLGVPDALLKAA